MLREEVELRSTDAKIMHCIGRAQKSLIQLFPLIVVLRCFYRHFEHLRCLSVFQILWQMILLRWEKLGAQFFLRVCLD
ncbi:hypothetical protein LCGC14_0010870 [marine sediment metagenome]|uniref:Uncharacterized protein n=1 Tax=marine sediment metagenome TaxID=412755 RepID=A0A0F9WGI3_9ZZZZ